MNTSRAVVHTPRTLSQALQLRADHPDALVLAGGTDLMVQIGAGTLAPQAVLNLWSCDELRKISDDGHRIGALATWAALARHPATNPALAECARTIGARQIQNRGTVGGNIVNASPAGDSLPMWLAMDAWFELASTRGIRKVSAADFFKGYREVDLRPDELLVAVLLPDMGSSRLYYRKVGTRLAQAISKVVLAGRLVVGPDGTVLHARVALGSVAPTPVRARAVEDALVGEHVDPSAAELVAGCIQPIDDIRSTAAYRTAVATNIVRTWLTAEANR